MSLNPFEEAVLPWLRGEVLDFGCGMGNLSFAAARQGCTVLALDASSAAIEHVRRRAASEHAPVSAVQADLRDYAVAGQFDAVVSIGLLAFFDCPTAFRVLEELKAHVRPGGVVAINVLIEGTSYLDMFDVSGHCLFKPEEMQNRFAGWRIERAEFSDFAAPRETLKRFVTIIARRPNEGWPAH
ncbi:MAG: class I SAM-dependent methyltransferase [Burkholderiales bacterium]|nr:class I SAM-dependent methyltransferase [Burkholderiales bacterium]